jgi:hypothetical protein
VHEVQPASDLGRDEITFVTPLHVLPHLEGHFWTMSEIDLIKGKIEATEAKLKKSEIKLEQLEQAEEKDAVEIKKWEDRRNRLEDLLTKQTDLLAEQQRKENLLLAKQGKHHPFTFIFFA